MLHIFSLLPLDQRLRAAQVSRAWRATVVLPALWRRVDFSSTSGVAPVGLLLRAAATRAGSALTALHVPGVHGAYMDAVCDLLRASPALVELRMHFANTNFEHVEEDWHDNTRENMNAVLAAGPQRRTTRRCRARRKRGVRRWERGGGRGTAPRGADTRGRYEPRARRNPAARERTHRVRAQTPFTVQSWHEYDNLRAGMLLRRRGDMLAQIASYRCSGATAAQLHRSCTARCARAPAKRPETLRAPKQCSEKLNKNSNQQMPFILT